MTREKENFKNEKLSLACSGKNNPFYGRKHSDETKKKMREKRKLQISPMKGRTHSIETKMKMREVAKERWKNGFCFSDEAIEKMRFSHLRENLTQDCRMRLSSSIKEKWKDPEYARRVMHRRAISKPEKFFKEEFIEKYCLAYDFTGNVESKTIVIGGKIPDFAHQTDLKVIEIWGDFFHKGQNPQDRIDFFKQHGYDCLVIWASELKSRKEVVKRVLDFTFGGIHG